MYCVKISKIAGQGSEPAVLVRGKKGIPADFLYITVQCCAYSFFARFVLYYI